MSDHGANLDALEKAWLATCTSPASRAYIAALREALLAAQKERDNNLACYKEEHERAERADNDALAAEVELVALKEGVAPTVEEIRDRIAAYLNAVGPEATSAARRLLDSAVESLALKQQQDKGHAMPATRPESAPSLSPTPTRMHRCMRCRQEFACPHGSNCSAQYDVLPRILVNGEWVDHCPVTPICGVSRGLLVCTEPPGHAGMHYDKGAKKGWVREDAPTGELPLPSSGLPERIERLERFADAIAPLIVEEGVFEGDSVVTFALYDAAKAYLASLSADTQEGK